MSSGGYRKVTIGRHWNRPKPKIYECNFQEHERQYQDPYRDYTDTKHFIREHASAWADQEASIRQELDNIQKYGTRRGASSTPRRFQHSDSPLTLRRSNSTVAAQDANAEGSYLRTRLEVNKERNYLADAKKSSDTGDTSSSTTAISSVRASSVPRKAPTAFDVSQDEEMANIEKRLLKLRKLREELGLPSAVGADPAPEPVSSKGRELNANMASTVAKTRATEISAVEDYSSSTKRAARASAAAAASSSKITNGRSSLTRDDTDDYKSDRSARRSARATASSNLTNGRASSSSREDKYSVEPSPRSTRRRKFEDTDSSVKTTKVSSTKSSASSQIIKDVDNYDDDSLLPDIRKKLPTSQEILDRIKGMDL